ncbi:GcrA family cell cycle regulator [Mesorhizobium caraganae]|uniref:GcrA family cell cycle regulator n=1 Tax=Mesorhizobium caraganae TaxID=483206 RepID=UPI001783B181|nr:GcrA family cell cycle regulator [Mesorhizobium caraganae]
MMSAWPQERRDVVADLLIEGLSASQIAERMGDTTRNAIIGIVRRDKRLSAIGFARTGQGGLLGPKMTPEERLEKRKKWDQAYRERNRGNVIAFPKPKRAPPRPAAVKQPALRVVSNNVPLMVQDWLEKNGGPRRFEKNATADTWAIRAYLEERGIRMNGHQCKWSVSMGPGRPRIMKWSEIIRLADEYRVAEGLQPFLAENQPENRRAQSS